MGGSSLKNLTGNDLAEAGYLSFDESTSQLQWDPTPEEISTNDQVTLATLVGVTNFDYGNFILI